jgi:AcrR family transcriptional regulator
VTAIRQPDEPSPRDLLLSAAIDYSLEHGIADMSLRELAEAIGTSHRMLIYHFGSKEQLTVAVVSEVEAAQRRAFAASLANGADSPFEAARRLWRRLADRRMWPQERLFFEVYVQALLDRPGTEGFLDDVVDAWTKPDLTPPAFASQDPADLRLGVAVVRGLLLDLLATGDRQGVNRAFERYLAGAEAVHDGARR